MITSIAIPIEMFWPLLSFRRQLRACDLLAALD